MISLPHCSRAAKKSSGDFSNAFFLCGMPAAQQPRPTIYQLLCVWDRVLLLGEVFQQQSSDKEILLSLYTPAAAPAHHLLSTVYLGWEIFKVQSTQSEDAERDFTLDKCNAVHERVRGSSFSRTELKSHFSSTVKGGAFNCRFGLLMGASNSL